MKFKTSKTKNIRSARIAIESGGQMPMAALKRSTTLKILTILITPISLQNIIKHQYYHINAKYG